MEEQPKKAWGLTYTRTAVEQVVLCFDTQEEAEKYVRETPIDELGAVIINDHIVFDEVYECCWEEHGDPGNTCVCELPKGHESSHSCDAFTWLQTGIDARRDKRQRTIEQALDEIHARNLEGEAASRLMLEVLGMEYVPN